MKNDSRSSLWAPLLVLVCLAASAQAKVTIKESSPGLQAKATYPGEKAIEQVGTLLPQGKIVEAELEEEGGRLIYSFDVRTAGKSGIDEVNISAMDGSLIGRDHEGSKAESDEAAQDAKEANAKVVVTESVPGLLAKATFPSEKAVAKVAAMFPQGSILSVVVEQEGKNLLYAFDVSLEGKTGVEDVDISATTGKLLHKAHLSPEKYLKEQQDDKNRAAAQTGTTKP